MIYIEPWPGYPSTGGAPNWTVHVSVPKFTGRLTWSQRLGRFTESSETKRLRMASKRALKAAETVCLLTLKPGHQK